MRVVTLFFLLTLPKTGISEQQVAWANRSDLHADNHSKVLKSVQAWASSFYKDDESIVEFNYQLIEERAGFTVKVLPIYTGDHILTDGEMCVSVTDAHVIVSAKQCIAP